MTPFPAEVTDADRQWPCAAAVAAVIVVPVNVQAVKVTHVWTGMREHWKVRYLQPFWWRFVDVNYFIVSTSMHNHSISD